MTRTRSYTYLMIISCSFHLENVFQLCTGLDQSCQGNVIVIELDSWLVSQIVHDVMPLCVLENFYENLCLCNGMLSP